MLSLLKAENEPGLIAIHCKVDFGRTGTLIGLWAMKHYQIPAEAFIGWIRIARSDQSTIECGIRGDMKCLPFLQNG